MPCLAVCCALFIIVYNLFALTVLGFTCQRRFLNNVLVMEMINNIMSYVLPLFRLVILFLFVVVTLNRFYFLVKR